MVHLPSLDTPLAKPYQEIASPREWHGCCILLADNWRRMPAGNLEQELAKLEEPCHHNGRAPWRFAMG
jgi:hypothetical protein